MSDTQQHDTHIRAIYEENLKRFSCPALPPAPERPRLIAALSDRVPPIPQSLIDAEERATCKQKRLYAAFRVLLGILVCIVCGFVTLTIITPATIDMTATDPAELVEQVEDVEFVPRTPEEALGLLEASDDFESKVIVPEMIEDIEDDKDGSITSFSLFDENAPTIDNTSYEEIENATSSIVDNGYPLGFLFMDIGTGRGICYNIDEDIYGASSFKAPLAAYILSNIADADGLPSSDYSRIEASVLYSDNDSFITLSNRYRHTDDFSAWADKFFLIEKDLFAHGDFATYSARDCAKIWSWMDEYLRSDAEHAEYLLGLLSDTNMSFIRNGIEQWEIDNVDIVEYEEYNDETGETAMYSITDATPEITVYNKAGWIAAGGFYNSTTDNAIISCDGRDYLMCIISGAPYSDRNAARISDLAYALFDVRGCLAEF